jgi:hypothetical protein
MSRSYYSSIYDFTVLHPCHKLQYFKTTGWEDDWIEMAHNIVREEFDQTYVFMDFDDEVVSMKKVRELSKPFYFLTHHCPTLEALIDVQYIQQFALAICPSAFRASRRA